MSKAAQIRAMARSGMADDVIAEESGSSMMYIRGVRSRARIPSAAPKKRGSKPGERVSAKTLAIAARIDAMRLGETFSDIAPEFGVTREYVRQIAKKHCGITGRGDLVNARRGQIADKALPLWFAGELSEGEIAKQCGCSRLTIRNILDDADVSPAMRRARAALVMSQAHCQKHNTLERAERAREIRENGSTYNRIGELMGTTAAQARNLVLYLGPDPLGRERPYYPRSGAAA